MWRMPTISPFPKAPNANLHPMPQQNRHNERVHIDFFGPLIPDRSYKYVMVMTDGFSKFLKLQPLPDKMAESVVDAFFTTWICEFGVPEIIVTDGGREFAIRSFMEFARG